MKPATPAEALAYVENAGADLINKHGEIALRILRATVRRDWDVRVLDAHAARVARSTKRLGSYEINTALSNRGELGWAVDIQDWELLGAETPDASRHTAALAVFPTLPAEVRANLGECP